MKQTSIFIQRFLERKLENSVLEEVLSRILADLLRGSTWGNPFNRFSTILADVLTGLASAVMSEIFSFVVSSTKFSAAISASLLLLIFLLSSTEESVIFMTLFFLPLFAGLSTIVNSGDLYVTDREGIWVIESRIFTGDSGKINGFWVGSGIFCAGDKDANLTSKIWEIGGLLGFFLFFWALPPDVLLQLKQLLVLM